MMLISLICFEKKERYGNWMGNANGRVPDLSGYHDYDECAGINTIIVDNKCKCMDEFPFGDPNGKGCYKCIDQCNESASCVYPGKCECEIGLYGDGITECYVPVPFVIDTPPSDLLSTGNEKVTIQIKPLPRFKPLKAYCKFENVVVTANSTNAHSITCISPKLNPGSYKIYVSFDNILYSSNYAFAQVTGTGFISVGKGIWIILIAIIGVIVYYFGFASRNGNSSQQDEARTPFIANSGKYQIKKRKGAIDMI